MRFRILLIGALLFLGAEAAVRAGSDRRSSIAKPDNYVVYTGYVDEESDSRYVLVGGGEMQFQAVLEPEVFKNDYFANFIGQRVIVRGRLVQSGDRPILHVKSIRLAPEEVEPSGPNYP